MSKPDNSSPILQGKALCFSYQEGIPALQDVDFHAEQGEFVALLASNGSGKTTLLKVLAGLLPVKSGQVLIEDNDIDSIPSRQLYGKIGLLMQNPRDQLFCTTVEEDVSFGPRNQGLESEAVEQRVVGALKAVGGAHLRERTIHQLSFGEQKRIALAGVLAMQPSVLLLDEVTAGLDPAGEKQMMLLLDRLKREQGITIVFATHSIDLLPLFADRIYVFEQGRMLICGTPAQVFKQQHLLERARLRTPWISSLFIDLDRLDGITLPELPLTQETARHQIKMLLEQGYLTRAEGGSNEE